MAIEHDREAARREAAGALSLLFGIRTGSQSPKEQKNAALVSVSLAFLAGLLVYLPATLAMSLSSTGQSPQPSTEQWPNLLACTVFACWIIVPSGVVEGVRRVKAGRSPISAKLGLEMAWMIFFFHQAVFAEIGFIEAARHALQDQLFGIFSIGLGMASILGDRWTLVRSGAAW